MLATSEAGAFPISKKESMLGTENVWIGMNYTRHVLLAVGSLECIVLLIILSNFKGYEIRFCV
jgi:hypothetical protein